MYDTSDIRKGLKVLMDGNPYTVIEFQFVKPGKGAAFTRTKFKNLLTGAVVERNIRSGEKLEPANVETRDMQFLYKEGGDLVFMDQTNYEQVTISADLIGDAHDLMKDNLPCTVVFFNERPVDVTLPTFVFLEVTASEPGVRGDTSGNVQKPATVETGAEVIVPLFIRVGDTDQDRHAHARVRRARQQDVAWLRLAAACSRSTADAAVVRGEQFDLRVDARAARLAAGRSRRRRRAGASCARLAATTIPAPGSEVMRLPRARLELLQRARARARRGCARSSRRATSSRSRRRCSCRAPGSRSTSTRCPPATAA